MSTTEPKTVFSDLLDLLAEGADRDRLMQFRLPDETQERLEELLDKNREGSLAESEKAELAAFEQLEHVVRLLKAKLFGQSSTL